VRAPAKVNLHLGVGQLRSDGFHSLVSVFQAVSIYDEITVDDADDLAVAIVGDDYDDVPTDTSNLAVRAAIALAHHVGRSPAVQITIRASCTTSRRGSAATSRSVS
jgi:4-diphosphocytidyl-2-C-methyl-D-erythritol kinase